MTDNNTTNFGDNISDEEAVAAKRGSRDFIEGSTGVRRPRFNPEKVSGVSDKGYLTIEDGDDRHPRITGLGTPESNPITKEQYDRDQDRWALHNAANGITDPTPYKELHVAYIMLIWLGVVGGHKFYLGRPGMGILWLLTFGLFGVGFIIDSFTLKQQVFAANVKRQNIQNLGR